MKTEVSLEGLVGDLVRRGLPVEYAERAVAELEDHRQDLLAEAERDGLPGEAAESLAAERLGNTKTLSRKIVRDYRRRSFAGRHPWWTFVAAPLPTMVLAWAALILTIWGAAEAAKLVIGDWGGPIDLCKPNPPWVHPAVCALLFLIVNFGPTATACIYAWLASRGGHGLRWLTAACLPLALVAAILFFKVESLPGGHGRVMFGLMLAEPVKMLRLFTSPLQLTQLLLPLVAATCIYSWHQWRFRPRLRFA